MTVDFPYISKWRIAIIPCSYVASTYVMTNYRELLAIATACTFPMSKIILDTHS